MTQEHIVYCDTENLGVAGLKVLPAKEQIATRFTGTVDLAKEVIAIYSDPVWLADGEKEDAIDAEKFLHWMDDRRVATAHVLEYLLEHQELIPESWKGKYVCFFGTLWSRVGGEDKYVMYLTWGGQKWNWDYQCIYGKWPNTFVAAVIEI